MKLYADRPLHATSQLLGDALALVWVVFWSWLASQVHDRIAALAGAGRGPAGAAAAYQDSVTDLARFAAIATSAIPILLMLAFWLPRRVLWLRAASAASRLMQEAGDSDRGTDLLALRALVHQPLAVLASTPGVGEDPTRAWRERDREALDALADLELRRLGLRAAR